MGLITRPVMRRSGLDGAQFVAADQQVTSGPAASTSIGGAVLITRERSWSAGWPAPARLIVHPLDVEQVANETSCKPAPRRRRGCALGDPLTGMPAAIWCRSAGRGVRPSHEGTTPTGSSMASTGSARSSISSRSCSRPPPRRRPGRSDRRPAGGDTLLVVRAGDAAVSRRDVTADQRDGQVRSCWSAAALSRSCGSAPSTPPGATTLPARRRRDGSGWEGAAGAGLRAGRWRAGER